MSNDATEPQLGLPLGALAKLAGAELIGDPSVQVTGFAGLQTAGPGEVTFAAGEAWRAAAVQSPATAIVVDEPLDGFAGAQLIHANPNLAFARLVSFALQKKAAASPGVHADATVEEGAEVDATATVGPRAVVAKGARIGPGSVLEAQVFVGEGAVVGADCRLRPGSRLMEGCILGDRVILQPNAVVGGDGFGYATDESGHHVKIPQTGIVRVGDDVEIGAGSTIDRARFDETVIGRGTKIDNLVMVAHNVAVGEDCFLVAQAGVAGSTKLGDRNVLGGHVGVSGHLTLEDDVQVGAYSGVGSNLKSGQWFGIPAMPIEQGRKATILHTKLPAMSKKLKDLERRLRQLEDGEGESEA